MAVTVNGYNVASLSLTYSFGSSPGSATLRIPLPAVDTVVAHVRDEIAINFGAVTFNGVVAQNPVRQDGGAQVELQLVDFRMYLMEDTVHLALNNSEVREDDPDTPGIDRQKRWWHILPEDWDAQIKTWTTVPYSAAECVNIVLGSSEVHDPWVATMPAEMDKPVFHVDAENGSKVASVLQEIADQLGMVYTLVGEWGLVFVFKGIGTVPSFPSNATERTLGEAMSNHDTRVRIVGGRNRYQDTPIVLEPSWISGYEDYWCEPKWIAKVKSVFFVGGSDDEALIAARAREVTVREFAAEMGEAFEDHDLWHEVSRMEIPVWLYCQDIVFKAYRVPRDYTVNGIPLPSLELHEGLLAAVEYGIDDGLMTLKEPREYYPEGKAFVVAKGQGLDIIDPRSRDILTADQLANAQDKWSAMNRFTFDKKNKVVVFHHAVFASTDLWEFPNQGPLAGADPAEPLLKIVVPNANATVSAAAVQATLVFDAERYSKTFGAGVRTGGRHWGGLNYHALMDAGAFVEEVKYADDKGADEKAAEFADTLSSQTTVYACGGYKRNGTAGTALNAIIDRVTVNLDFSGGLTERVDFTKERSQSNFEHERALDRRVTGRDLFPNQKHTKDEVEQLRLIATLSKDNARSSPTAYATLSDVPTVVIGNQHPGVVTLPVAARQAGEAIFLSKADWTPSDLGTIFGGIVIASGYTSLSGDHRGACATQGVVPVRCQGPFEIGDVLGVDFGSNRANVIGAKIRPVGVVQAKLATTATVLAPVRLGAEAPPTPDAWSIRLVPGEAGSFNYTVYPSTLNNLIPDNDFAAAIGSLGDAAKYVVLEVATDGKQVTGLHVGESDTPPPPPACLMGAPPTAFKVPLAYLGTTSAPTYRQIWKDPLVAIRVLCHQTDRTTIPAGQSPWDNWWTWVVAKEVGPQHIAL